MTIEEIVGDAGTLEVALQRASGARPPWRVVDVIAQDEYTHDVILGAKGGRWAVLDLT